MLIRDLPIEIQEAIVEYQILHGKVPNIDIPVWADTSVNFDWSKTHEGTYFWNKISEGSYRDFYNTYPASNTLKKPLPIESKEVLISFIEELSNIKIEDYED